MEKPRAWFHWSFLLSVNLAALYLITHVLFVLCGFLSTPGQRWAMHIPRPQRNQKFLVLPIVGFPKKFSNMKTKKKLKKTMFMCEGVMFLEIWRKMIALTAHIQKRAVHQLNLHKVSFWQRWTGAKCHSDNVWLKKKHLLMSRYTIQSMLCWWCAIAVIYYVEIYMFFCWFFPHSWWLRKHFQPFEKSCLRWLPTSRFACFQIESQDYADILQPCVCQTIATQINYIQYYYLYLG